MKQLGRYEQYRTTETEWCPEVPHHWGFVPIRRIGRVTNGGTPAAEPHFWNGEIPFMTPPDLRFADGREVASTQRTVTRAGVEAGSSTVNAGSIVVSIRAPIGYVGRTIEETAFNQGCRAITPDARSDPRYTAYSLVAARDELDAQGRGTTFMEVSGGQFLGVHVPLPPLDDQKAIADFLDDQTSRINTLIAKQDQLIIALGERRAAVSVQAVTKGRRAHASMQPSGLRWAREVPASWKVANIRRFAAMKTGHTPSRSNAEYWMGCTIPWVTLADVWQLRDGRATYLAEETATHINELGLANSAAELLPAGTVVLSRTASVGFAGIMPVPMATSQDYWNWVCGPELLPTFLLATFRAMRSELGSMVMGSTHQTIYQPIAAAMSIVVPPLDEQREIVEFLDNQTSRIDALIAKTEEHIKLAKERRVALITAAVTGKIDVRTAGRAIEGVA
ncbi:restriction endonuclease subunit S [Cellulomonas sp. Root137]|uniref:restriction endonuclease subunit S n=1 Tax=Cellulomonas sp. Root137 TaxID=1736459 RepID=UPI0006FBBDF4|nr:restriction endonuclease subunit S [Cellulomonas sp. Root137]KQY46739.1 hypothetical protein ASD18_04805 [Cellulomonas sp. Root137]